MYMYTLWECGVMCVCIYIVYLQELERAFMEAKSQVESGAVEYGDSDDENTREVSCEGS